MTILPWVVLLVVTRETFLRSTIGLTSSAIIPKESSVIVNYGGSGNLQESESPKSVKSYLSFNQAISIIREQTPPEFISAVVRSERFLYRGEEEIGSRCAIMAPEPDLLLFDTYSNDDALGYFEQLEKCTRQNENNSENPNPYELKVRPSNGHIGTSVYSEAAMWGTPVSVWPVGSAFSFAYPRDRELFFDEKNPVKASTIATCQLDVEYDHDLAGALILGKEVMFATWGIRQPTLAQKGALTLHDSAFVTIPSKYDREVLSLLKP